MARLNAFEVIREWFRLGPEEYATADFGTRSGSCYVTGNVLYNYGSHFPLAVFTGLKGKKKQYLLNGDRHRGGGGWGPATSSLQRSVIRYAPSAPIVSASGVEAAGIRFAAITREAIHDHTQATRIGPLLRKERRYYLVPPGASPGDVPLEECAPWTPPRQGSFQYRMTRPDDGTCVGEWHILGAVLLRWQGHDYLCGVDEGRYFVSQLRHRAATVTAALLQLQPPEVRAAIAAGLDVKRQGEWFFIPTGLDDRGLADYLHVAPATFRSAVVTGPLPETRTDKANRHYARHVVAAGAIYARGAVTHRIARQMWSSRTPPLTREHATLYLGDRWHRAVPNTEVASWGMTGKFD